MIYFDNIYKNYHQKNSVVTALSGVTLQINKGEIFGIIGKTGAGKSTLLRCINGLERPDRGRVIVDGQTITELTPHELMRIRRKIGMIFQHFHLLATRTVFANIALPLQIAGASSKHITTRVHELLAWVNLTDRAQHYPSQLSGGQKQRVAIARALANEPTVLLCDEATSALDPESTSSILTLLAATRERLGITIVLITHQMSVIKQICDRAAVMYQGAVIEQNTVPALFYEPKHSITQQFVASSIRHELPMHKMQTLSETRLPHTFPVLRLWFQEHHAADPIITLIARDTGVDISILQANIETICDQLVGIMIIVIRGDEAQVSQAIHHLARREIKTEVVGYVA